MKGHRSTITVLPVTAPAPTVHAFNTGRLYTTAGQRIAWTVLPSGNVAMYDLDRMIDYVLRFDGHPNNATVLRAYDHHECAPFAEFRDDHYAARDLESTLIAAARAVAPVRL